MFASRSVKYMVTCLLVISLASLIAAMFTSLGFPYRADPATPSQQRLFVHVCHSCIGFTYQCILLVELTDMIRNETQLPQRDRASMLCQLKSCVHNTHSYVYSYSYRDIDSYITILRTWCFCGPCELVL